MSMGRTPSHESIYSFCCQDEDAHNQIANVVNGAGDLVCSGNTHSDAGAAIPGGRVGRDRNGWSIHGSRQAKDHDGNSRQRYVRRCDGSGDAGGSDDQRSG